MQIMFWGANQVHCVHSDKFMHIPPEWLATKKRLENLNIYY